jgi:hypothetical protein
MFEEQVYRYLDRSLGDAESADLFHVLAVSPEKRDLFADCAHLREILKAHAESIAAPANAYASLQAAAAATAPAVLPAAPAAIGLPVLGIGAALILALGFGIGSWWASMHARSGNVPAVSVAQPVIHPSTTSEPLRAEAEAPGAPSTGRAAARESVLLADRMSASANASSPSIDAPASLALTPAAQQSSIAPAFDRSSLTAPPSATAATATSAIAPSASAALAANNPRDSSVGAIASPTPTGFPLPAPVAAQAGSGGGRIVIDLAFGRSVPRSSGPWPALRGSGIADAFDLRAGVGLAPGWAVGLFAGQSSFGLTYATQPASDVLISHEQYATLFHGGAWVDASLGSLAGVETTARIEMGETSIGPFGGIGFGAAVHPMDAWRIGGSILYRDLVFRQSGALHTSDALTLSVGGSIDLHLLR